MIGMLLVSVFMKYLMLKIFEKLLYFKYEKRVFKGKQVEIQDIEFLY